MNILIYEIHLAVEGTHTARYEFDNTAQNGNVIGRKRVPSRPKRIKSLTVLEQDCLLRLLYNQLRLSIKVLGRMLPDESRIITLKFDDI